LDEREPATEIDRLRGEVEKFKRRKRIREMNDLRDVLRTAEGRRVMMKVLEWGGPFRSSFDAENDRQDAFNQGKREIGIMLMAEINEANSTAIQQMIRENLSDKKSDDAEIRKITEADYD
jgi:hypothetical protein